ncbi:ribonuclease HII [bacterium D16-51]|nr:ribonuclease HII [bacterium D16-59]RKI61759.1 ribonuclease HII [bacterium D16-51]
MAKAIYEIKEELAQASWEQRKLLLTEYGKDSRKGVQNLVAQYRKRAKALFLELERLDGMRVFEKKYSLQYPQICGIDEAGRGPLAGPVVAGACILPEDAQILYLNDSKKLSAKKRELLYDEICEKAVAYSIGIASPQRIDKINILQATYEAMQQAVAGLSVTPDLLLVDAVRIPDVPMKQVGIVQGDAKSVSIAAASILAKVTRDRMMLELDSAYPEYGFAKHKGYGSAMHIQAIKKYGPSPIHRKTFIKNFV